MKKAYLISLLGFIFIATSLVARDRTVSLQIKQASDDMEEWLDPNALGETDYSSSDLELGQEKGTNQLIAVRFQDLKIPQGRTIKSAYLQFELDANAKTVDPFSVDISVEDADSAATYNGNMSVAYELTNRTRTAQTVDWDIPAGAFNTVDMKYNSADISSLVQATVNRGGWKAGNAIAFYIQGVGCREVEAYEGEPTAAAKLFVTYEMTAADSIAEIATLRKKTVAVQLIQASDDIEEWIDPLMAGATDYNSSDLELGRENKDGTYPQLVGVRFSGIPVGKDRIITDAYLEFQLDATSKTADPFAVHIWAEDADSASTFNGVASAPYSVSSRVKLADSIAWNIPTGAFNTVGMRYPTSNILPLVQQLVDRTNWKNGNAMAFYIKGQGTREVESFESGAASSAKLYITYCMLDEDIAQHVADSIAASAYALLTTQLDSVKNVFAARVTETNYTVPSWTIYKRAEVTYVANRVIADSLLLINAQAALVAKEMPYTVAMSINGDPTSRLGFTWYTNLGELPGVVEIVPGVATDASAFTAPAFTVAADTLGIRNLNYCGSANGLLPLAGIANSSKRNYTSHKALASGLTANTTYSYRVGTAGAWSPIGTFKTSPTTTDFGFMYIADTQSNTDEMFSISAKTIQAGVNTIQDPRFCLMAGDLVETSGSSNNEWEWEQWFETNKAVLKNLPVAAVCGNHDVSVNKNITNHFNNMTPTFDKNLSTSPGSIYSFVYGDALFIACSTENYSNPALLDSLKNFIRASVAANPNVKWKFAFYHKAIYSGASHQNDGDAKTVRQALVPVFDEVGIDMAFQGHDHVYEVIGATKNFALANGTAMQVDSVSAGGVRENMTGKEGGIFNVKNGTLYFLNNSAGRKKYEPKTKAQMDASTATTGITNYWGLFTGKFGQTGEPTFSDVRVTADTVYVTTYTVSDSGVPTKFDSFKVVKTNPIPAANPSVLAQPTVTISPNPASSVLNINGIDNIENVEIYNLNGQLELSAKGTNQLSVSALADGVYMIKIKSGNRLYVEQVIVKK